jgi:beta-barrel assembly-enhancing protease
MEGLNRLNSLNSLKRKTMGVLIKQVLVIKLCLLLLTAWMFAVPTAVLAQSGTGRGTDSSALTRIPINLPKLGDAADEDLPLSLERRIGEEIYRDYLASGEVVNDPELQDYVWQVASKLTRTSNANGYEFTFFIVRSPQINAFALPGGFIGVHTGLIAAAQSEAELASVLGHEIAHVTQRHIARMLSKQKQGSALTLASLVLAALAARSNPQAAFGVLALSDTVQTGNMLSFSRDAEREADRIGFDMLSQAGFDSSGMASFFMRLQQANRLNESRAPEYARTHPITQDRINDAQLRVREGRYKQKSDSPEFIFNRAKLQASTDESVDGLMRARSNFEAALREKTTNNDVGTAYGLAYVAFLQRDFVAVEKYIADLKKRFVGTHPMIDDLIVQTALSSNQAEKAKALADASRLRFPQSRALVQSYARALLQLKQFDAAAKFLEEQTTLTKGDHQLLELLAKAYDGSGRAAMAHQASAERYALLGSLQEAVTQLTYAQKAGGTDFYTGSKIDARLRDLQQTLLRDRAERRAANR